MKNGAEEGGGGVLPSFTSLAMQFDFSFVYVDKRMNELTKKKENS